MVGHAGHEQNLSQYVQGTVFPKSSQHSHTNRALLQNNCEERLIGNDTPGISIQFTYELIRLEEIRELTMHPSSCKFPDYRCFIH